MIRGGSLCESVRLKLVSSLLLVLEYVVVSISCYGGEMFTVRPPLIEYMNAVSLYVATVGISLYYLCVVARVHRYLSFSFFV